MKQTEWFTGVEDVVGNCGRTLALSLMAATMRGGGMDALVASISLGSSSSSKEDAGAVLGAVRVRWGYVTGAALPNQTKRLAPNVVALLRETRRRFPDGVLRTGMLLHTFITTPGMLGLNLPGVDKIDVAALEKQLRDGTLATEEDLTPFEVPSKRSVKAPPSYPLAGQPTAFFRVEWRAFSGSTVFVRSWVGADITRFEAALCEEVRFDDMLAMLLESDSTLMVEQWDGGDCVLRSTLSDRVTCTVAGQRVRAFAQDADLLERLIPQLEPGATRAQVDLTQLSFSAPSAPPAAANESVRLPLSDGVQRAHPPGWVGGFDFALTQLPLAD